MARPKKAKVPEEQEENAVRTDALSAIHLTKMLLVAARVAETKALLKFHTQNVAHQAALGELNATRLEAQTHRNLLTAKAAEEGARAAHQANLAASTNVAEELGKHYAVDWRTASFDPETGAIIRHSGELT
jgi:hypothetical protein